MKFGMSNSQQFESNLPICGRKTTLPLMPNREFHQSESLSEQRAPNKIFSSAHSHETLQMT